MNQVIYSLDPISLPNIKALTKILFEISCTQDFFFLFKRDITWPEKTFFHKEPTYSGPSLQQQHLFPKMLPLK